MPCCAQSARRIRRGSGRQGQGLTLDAELDQVGVDVVRVWVGHVPALEGRGRDALVEKPVLEQTKVLQAVPLRSGLGVLTTVQQAVLVSIQ